MRIGMWMGAPLRALGVVATMALAACGGGSEDSAPALAVTVTIDGVAEASGPLTAGETGSVEVPSGATLVFASEGETRWEPAATASTYTVNSFSFTSKSMTVSSNAGGSLVVVFTNKADESEKATLNVTVAPKEFERVERVDGEIEAWSQAWTDSAGAVTQNDLYQRITLRDGGGYSVESGSAPDAYSLTLGLYDAQDRYMGFLNGITGIECLYDVPVANVSYPMHVGKSWSGDAKRVCGDMTLNQHYVRSVEAFERVIVPEGTHDALRMKIEATYRYGQTGGEAFGYTMNGTCWWAVDLGRNVKCDYVFHYDDGSSDSRKDVMTSLTR